MDIEETKKHLDRLRRIIESNQLSEEELFTLYLKVKKLSSTITGNPPISPEDVVTALKIYLKEHFPEFLESLETKEDFYRFFTDLINRPPEIKTVLEDNQRYYPEITKIGEEK